MQHTRSIGHSLRRPIFGLVCALSIALSGQAEAASISLAWDAPPEQVTGYIVHYGTQSGVYAQSVDVGPVTSYVVTGLTIRQYYFVVQAYNSAGTSPFSAEVGGLAVYPPFTDDPLVAGVSIIKAIHFQELRDRIDAVRVSRALSTVAWTDPVLSPGAVEVRAIHVSEMRSALDAVYAVVGIPVPTYTNTMLQGGVIWAVDFAEVRTRVVAVR